MHCFMKRNHIPNGVSLLQIIEARKVEEKLRAEEIVRAEKEREKEHEAKKLLKKQRKVHDVLLVAIDSS